jgi:hypothetical protein
MIIKFDNELSKKFTEVVLKNEIEHSKERSGYHRSDCITCPEKPFNRVVRKLEAIFSPETIGIFLIGELAHLLLHQNFTAQEYEIMVADIVSMHIDAIAQGSDFQNLIGIEDWKLDEKRPIESKTTRKVMYKQEDIPNEWLEQLAFGMAHLGVNIGYLMIVNMINFSVKVVTITMTNEERDMYKDVFLWKISLILDAVNKEDDSKLEPHRFDCKYCEYRPCKKRKLKNPEDKGCPKYNPFSTKDKKEDEEE